MDHFDFLHKIAKMGLDHQAKQMPQQPAEPSQTDQPTQYMADGGSLLAGPALAAGGGPSSSGGLLGGLGNLLGISNTYRPSATSITPGTNTTQLNNAYTGVQNALNATGSAAQMSTPGYWQGLGNEANLANQLNTQAAGGGPNPALAELNQATGQNNQQTAALLASQQGAGTNAGLIGEQIARNSAANQQNAVGQAATLSAEQQIAAQQQATNLAATQVNQGANAFQAQSQQQQNEQNILQGANSGTNNANVSAQGSLNNLNASIAGQNASTNANLLGGLAAGGSSAISTIAPVAGVASVLGLAKGGIVKMDKGGNVLDANARKHIAPEHFALPGGRYPIHDAAHARNALARVSQYGTPSEKAKVRAAVEKLHPGIVQMKAAGGPIESNPLLPAVNQGIQPLSAVGQWLNSTPVGTSQSTIQSAPILNAGGEDTEGFEDLGTSLGNALKNKGPTPIAGAGSPLGGDAVMGSAGAGQTSLLNGDVMAARGGKIPGKPKTDHDSLENDVVPADIQGGGKAMLSPGELVIDLNTMKDPGPMGKMARALAKHIEAKNRGGRV